MEDLHEQLREAITIRKAVAVGGAIPFGPRWSIRMTAGALGPDAAEHIAAHDPAAVLRHCERDLKVLGRHYRMPQHPTRWCRWCLDAPWPCVEIRDLAEAYGIEVHGG